MKINKKEIIKKEIISNNIKNPLIKEIYRLDPLTEKIGINLSKYNVEQLQKHIECLKKRI